MSPWMPSPCPLPSLYSGFTYSAWSVSFITTTVTNLPPSADGFQFDFHLPWTPHWRLSFDPPQLNFPDPNPLCTFYLSHLKLLIQPFRDIDHSVQSQAKALSLLDTRSSSKAPAFSSAVPASTALPLEIPLHHRNSSSPPPPPNNQILLPASFSALLPHPLSPAFPA